MPESILILALQGDFTTHAKAAQSYFPKAKINFLKQPRDLTAANSVDLFIIPGGESSAFSKLMDYNQLYPVVEEIVNRPQTIVLTTCAGTILLAKDIKNPGLTRHIPILDIEVERNAYGRQIDSFIAPLELTEEVKSLGIEPDKLSIEEKEAFFVRAPQILHCRSSVSILGYVNRKIVLVRQGNILAATFHPEHSQHSVVYSILQRLRERIIA